jgi:hypothetical protein
MDITSELLMDEGENKVTSFVFNFNSKYQESEVIIRSPCSVGKKCWDEFYEAVKNNTHYYLTLSEPSHRRGAIGYDGVKLSFYISVEAIYTECTVDTVILINKRKCKEQFLICLRSLLDDQRISEFWT